MTHPHSDSLLGLLDRKADGNPGVEAFHFAGRGSWTWRAFRHEVDNLARAMGHALPTPGAPVLIALPNSPEFLFALFAVYRTGGIPAPLFPGGSSLRLNRLAARCGAAGIVIPDSRKPVPGETAGLRSGLRLQRPPFENNASSGMPSVLPDANKTALVQFTSGSTGQPSAVPISHSALATNIRQMSEAWNLTHRDSFVNWLPLYHDMGLILMTLTPLVLGSPPVLMQTGLKRIRRWFRLVREHKGTITAAPDFAYRFALTYVHPRQHGDLSSLRIAVNAAEPVRLSTIKRFEKTFAIAGAMRPAYGLAEATAGVCCVRPGVPIHTDGAGNVSVGRPFPGIRIRTRDTEHRDCKEIQVNTPAATRGYIGFPESPRGLFTPDGWLRTGDRGFMDSRGELYVLGRLRHTLRQEGRTLGVREVEELMESLNFVRRCAAAGIDPGGIDGERIVIFLEFRNTRLQAARCRDLIAIAVKEFHDYFGFRPGRVVPLRPRGIPLTVNGKIRYSELATRFLSGDLDSINPFPDHPATSG